MSSKGSGTSGRILRNSAWIGLESIVETLVMVGSSVAVARYLGPNKLGYFTYINFYVGVVTRTSGHGLASATRKYMSEYLALDQPGTARAVYKLAHRYQLLGSMLIAAVSLGAILLFGAQGYKLMASILILSLVPGIMSWVPAQANNAFEDAQANTVSALGYIFTYAVTIACTLIFHWDLIGVASAMLIGRTTETILRTIPLHRKLSRFPLDPLSAELKRRIRDFCIQAFGVQLLMSVVWDRSEMVFLRAFSSLEQIAFYSVSLGLAGNLLVVPRAFGDATGLSLMAQASRDPERVNGMIRNACRFLLFVIIPVHLGAAAIAKPAVHLVYGLRYAGAVPAMAISAVLVMARVFQNIPETLLQTADRQRRLLQTLIVAGVFNIALDALAIPHYGSTGAALANGVAQAGGIMYMWYQAKKYYSFSFPLASAFRLGFAGTLMGITAWLMTHFVPGVLGMVAAIVVAGPVYLLLVKLLHGLEASDRARLEPLGRRLPGAAGTVYRAAVNFATPAPPAQQEVAVP